MSGRVIEGVGSGGWDNVSKSTGQDGTGEEWGGDKIYQDNTETFE